MIGTDTALTGVMREAAFLAPAFSARTAFGLSAPKLIAEILKTDAEYGLLQSGPPMVTRNSAPLSAFGATE